jgi:FkbM family methyltransferase
MKKRLKTQVRQLPVVGVACEYLLKRVLRRQIAPGLEIRLLARKLPKNAFILQIGSNDGCTNDPIHDAIVTHPHWQCVFVEPVPWLLEKCRETYGSSKRFKYVDAAINDGSDASFFYVDPSALVDRPDLPPFVLQLGSFEIDFIAGYKNGLLNPWIRSLAVKGLSWRQLLHQAALERVDLLHIDAEGYDWKILKQIDFSCECPGVILFESLHLDREELNEAVRELEHYYKLKKLDGDMLAVRKDI